MIYFPASVYVVQQLDLEVQTCLLFYIEFTIVLFVISRLLTVPHHRSNHFVYLLVKQHLTSVIVKVAKDIFRKLNKIPGRKYCLYSRNSGAFTCIITNEIRSFLFKQRMIKVSIPSLCILQMLSIMAEIISSTKKGLN